MVDKKRASKFTRDLRFRELYNNEIAPVIVRLENERQQRLRKFLTETFLFSSSIIIGLVVLCLIIKSIYVFIPIFILSSIICKGLSEPDSELDSDSHSDSGAYFWASFCCLNIGLLLLALVSATYEGFPFVIILITIIVVAIASKVPLKIYNKFNTNYAFKLKELFLDNLIKIFGDIQWSSQNYKSKFAYSYILSDYDIEASGLFLDNTIRYDDDKFCGNWHGVKFNICETQLIKDEQQYHAVFKGVILLFEANKMVKNRTIVSTKEKKTRKNQHWDNIIILWSLILIALLFAYLCNKDLMSFLLIPFGFIIALDEAIKYYDKHKKDQEPLNSVQLEDIEFNKKFDIYSSDQVEARYLLTTTFMNRLLNLKNAFNSKKIKCSFFDQNKLMIAISTDKNLFELGSILQSTKNPECVFKMYEELSSILEMIDYFKLDEKTGL